MSASETTEPRTSERFSNPDSSSSSSPTGTVALVSSDNVRFYIDRAKLERESDAFPPADAQLAPGETVPLTEDGDTLELLLRFVDREEYVNLDDVEFSLLARLAEAAQKYRVYSAMSLCRVFMRAQHDKHPVEVLVYALKHGHDDIVDLAAPHTVGTPCSEMHAAMPSTSHYIAWTLYNDKHVALVNLFLAQHSGHNCNRVNWVPVESDLLVQLHRSGGVKTLRNLDSVFREDIKSRFGVSNYTCCINDWNNWKAAMQKSVRLIPPFTQCMQQ